MPEKSSEEVTRDETAVNHEIATLLLNLASRTHSVDKPMKADPEVAMDLSKSSYSHQTTSPSTTTSTNPYSLFPLTSPSATVSSLPSSTSIPTTLNSIPSTYLLQNLLIGKMQQQLNSDRVTTTVNEAGTKLSMTTSPPPLLPMPKLSSNPHTNIHLSNNPHSNIPLLSGQIVAQLNALLFSIHGLTDKKVEAKVEVQLSAIFTRLQEIVTLVNITKQGSDDVVGSSDMSDPLEEYTSVIPKVTATVSSPDSCKLELANSGGQLRVVQPFSKDFLLQDKSIQSRKSGGPRDGPVSDYSPPEKRCKSSPEDTISSSPAPVPRKTSKGGKGIRNRVFCGDCPGCLKNDDCGQCRYCRDKTKFGGQNRLRQKCLHRRCQMDTHRRSAAAAAGQQTQQPPVNIKVEPAIYSGVDLARLASHEAEERQTQYSSMLGSSPFYGSSPEPEGQPNHQSRIDKWKAKHQAMLKLAAEGRDQAPPSPPPEHRKLVITLEKEEEEEEGEVKGSARFQPSSMSTALVV